MKLMPNTITTMAITVASIGSLPVSGNEEGGCGGDVPGGAVDGGEDGSDVLVVATTELVVGNAGEVDEEVESGSDEPVLGIVVVEASSDVVGPVEDVGSVVVEVELGSELVDDVLVDSGKLLVELLGGDVVLVVVLVELGVVVDVVVSCVVVVVVGSTVVVVVVVSSALHRMACELAWIDGCE
jgi:hypothetical protein